MKKILTSVAMVLLLAGCAKEYDDSGIKARLDAVETKLNELEGNIMALQSAIGEGVFVAKVQEHIDAESGKTDGVTITYTNGDVKWFKIETNVADVNDPVIGVISSGSGSLVWAVNGTAILIDGKEVPVYQTPVFSLDDEGYLWVEVDGKKTKLGQVKNEGATLKDGIFTDIKVVEDAEGKRVVLTLSDNSIVNIPFAEAFELTIQETDFVYEEVAPIQIPFNVTAATAKTVVGVAGYDPTDFEVTVDMEAKIIEVTPLWPAASGVFMAYADSKIGLTSIVTVSVAPIKINPVDPDAEYDPEAGIYVNYFAEADAGSVDVQVVSNVPFQVVSLVDWITVADNTKALKKYSLPLLLADNKTKDYRDGEILLIKADANPASYEDDDILQSIIIRQWAPITGPANLSKEESANSYLIYAPGEYKFKAVKGNSTESVGTVAKAEILWETEYAETAPAANSIIASVAYADGFITFATPETLKPGAAVIVAKDASDVVLWNWLIWIPETEVSNINNEAFYGLPVMDRNLGAMKAATVTAAGRETYGMYYQWGRNNPLPGKVAASAEFTVVEGPKSTDYAIANPTIFIKVGESDSAGNWNEADLENLWEDAEGKKAMFDPCPPGYKVPTFVSEKGMWAANNEGWTYSWDSNNYSYGDIVFPMAGWYSSSASVGYEGERSIIHSATAHSNPRDRNKIIRKDKSGYYYSNYFKQEAASVRCVVVNEGAIVPPTPVENIVDLSEEGTANCYIVSEAGKFKFKTVKGNGAESVGTVDKAEIIWETYNNDEEVTANSVIAEVSYADDYIKFSTPETLKPGNALIAAKDAEGKILWSWHIWIPATTVTDVTSTAFKAGDVQVIAMDRNLGALEVATKESGASVYTFGLYYQWGRKDPFPAAKRIDSGSQALVAGTVTTVSEALLSDAEATEQPTVIGFQADKPDWINPSDMTRWADAAKSVNDPCPVGYRVPARNKSFPFMASNLEAVTDYVYSADNHYFAVGTPAVVFPLAGFRKYSKTAVELSQTGIGTVIWTAYSSTAGQAYCVQYDGDETREGKKVRLTEWKNGTTASVRCVAE